MAQLHCYVPEDIARQAQHRAEQAGLSLSRYLAELVKRDAAQASGWPVSLDDVWRALTGRKQTIDWERLNPRPLPASAPAPAASAPASAPVKGPRHD